MPKERTSWGVVCVMPSCRARKRDEENLKFFRFPKPGTELFEKWFQVCKLPTPPVSKNNYICSKHFNSSCVGKKKLLLGSIPTLNLEKEGNDEFNSIPVIFSGKTYERPTTNQDCILEDLAYLDQPAHECENKTQVESFCKNCIKSQQNVDYYRKKYTDILKKYKKLKTKRGENLIEKAKAKKRYTRKSKQLKELKTKTKNSLHQQIDMCKSSEKSRTFSKMILKSKASWTNDEKMLAQCLNYSSSSCYKYMRNSLKFNLPSIRSLQRWMPIKYILPGLNKNIIDGLQNVVANWSDENRESVLVFDEVSIRRDLTYNVKLDQIIGFVNLGNDEIHNVLGKQICLFMVRGILSNWKLVIAYFVTETAISGKQLSEKLKEALKCSAQIGFKIRGIVCDQGANNRKCINILGATNLKPYFNFEGNKYYTIYDVPHIIKSIRNNLMKNDFETPDGIVTWKCIEDLVKMENENVTKMGHKLTGKHINPNKLDKMNVRLAVQVFSRTCSAAIKSAADVGLFSDEVISKAKSTSEFISKLDKIFDCLNGKNPFCKNVYKAGLKRNGYLQEYLKEMVIYIGEIKLVQKAGYGNLNKISCFRNLIQSINGIISLTEDIFENYKDIRFFLPYKVNQDVIENLFGLIRNRGGLNPNPSVNEFMYTLAKIMSNKMLNATFSNDFKNCENDEENLLSETMNNVEEITEDMASENLEQENVIANNTVEVDMLREDTFILENINPSIMTENVDSEDLSLRYFAGYVLSKLFSITNQCSKCLEIMARKDEKVSLCHPSEYFIFHKNYSNRSDFGSLIAPSEEFF